MPDENRFAGLTDAMEEESEKEAEELDDGGEPSDDVTGSSVDTERTADQSAGTEPTPDDEPSPDAESATDENDETGETRDAAGDDTDVDAAEKDPVEIPAFAFEEASPKSIYVRDETLALLEDAEFEVEAALRRDREIRNVTGREFHDAAVRVLAEHAEEIAEEVVRLREEE